MNWQRGDSGFVCDPYVVKYRQRRWVAQRHEGMRHPKHLGSFATADEAKAACEKARGQ